MGNDQSPPAKLDRRFEGEPVQVGDQTVQPVGRMTGRRVSAGNEQGGFSGILAQLIPLEIIVREGEEEYTIPVTDPQREPLRGVHMTGVAVCAGCILVMLMANRMAKRRTKS